MNKIVSCWPVNDFVRIHRYVWQYLKCVSGLGRKASTCLGGSKLLKRPDAKIQILTSTFFILGKCSFYFSK